MITQYQITLLPEREMRIYPEWSYHLYSSLLSLTPHSFGEQMHSNGITPVSSYITVRDKQVIWRVNLLGADSEAVLSPILEQQERYYLRRENQSLRVNTLQVEHIDSADTLLQLPECSTIKLRFLTPTAFKSDGNYVNLPSVPLIMRNLLNKWNGCFTEECPIEDEDGEGIRAIANGIRMVEYRLSSRDYLLKGQSIPGFTGEGVLKCRLTGFHLTAANLLLHFAPYAGVGIKTALGMGGVIYE